MSKIQVPAYSNVESIEEMVLRIVGDHLGIPGPALSLDSHITQDLGADSLDRLELIMTVEELFAIKIPEENIVCIERIDDIVSAIKKTQSQSGNTLR